MAPPPPPAFTFAVPPSLSAFNVPIATYLQSHPEYAAICGGAFVFNNQDQILLLQRAASDTMPNRWESPGGAVDASDTTILYGVARELWEEAGLVVRSFQAPVGTGRTFHSSRGLVIFKVEFWVEAESTGDVVLDPEEHQRFVWASEDECRAKRVGSGEGAVEIEFTSADQEESVLEGFRLRREARGDGGL